MIEELRRRANTYLKMFRLSRSEAHELLAEIDALQALAKERLIKLNRLEQRYADARQLLLEVATNKPRDTVAKPTTPTSRGWGACR